MSYVKSSAFSLLFAFSSVLALGGCSASSDESTADSTSEHLSGKIVTVDFAGDFTTSTTGTLAVGETAKIAYDASRLTTCRGDANDGSPGWTVSAFYRVNGGPIASVTVAGHVADPSETPTFPLTTAGDLEIWFQNTSMWGCSAYDSAYGANYHFTIVASATAPGWVGLPQTVLSRATCGTPPNACDSDFQTMTTGFTYDTWTRERAAIKRAYRTLYLGDGGLDTDKIYVSPADFARAGSLEPLRRRAVTYVVLKRYNAQDPSTSALVQALGRDARLVASFTPYRAGVDRAIGEATPPFIHNTDARIGAALERPGPIIDIWTLN